jgi:DNA-binding response OmpR family regulator
MANGQNRPRILAVDDSEDILELILMTLSADYDVVALSNPVDLYEVLDVFEPDLLVLDVMMPRITGFQLTEMLRKNSATKDLPIIILSAKSSAGEIKHGYKLGATLYLTKPFQPDRLTKNIETQFRIHPSKNTKKTNDLHAVAEALENMGSFRKGQIATSDSIRRKEFVVDARKKMEEKIRKDQANA